MSYTPHDHNIDEPIDQIIEGIEVFNYRAENRMKGEGYNTEHIYNLEATVKRLLVIKFELIRYKKRDL